METGKVSRTVTVSAVERPAQKLIFLRYNATDYFLPVSTSSSFFSTGEITLAALPTFFGKEHFAGIFLINASHVVADFVSLVMVFSFSK